MASSMANIPFQTVITCDRCSSTADVNSFCLTCSGSLCDSCKQLHLDDTLLRRHRIVQWTDREAVRARKFASEPCQHHPGQIYVTYCSRCYIPCCVECVEKIHQQHPFQSIESAASKSEKELELYLQGLESEVQPQLKKTLDKIAEEIDTYNKSADQTFANVKEKFKDLKKQLNSLEEEMLVDLDNMKQRETAEIRQMQVEIVQNAKATEENINICRSKLNSASNVAILSLVAELPKVESLRPPTRERNLGTIRLQEANFVLPSTKEMIGEFVRKQPIEHPKDEVTQTLDNFSFAVEVLKTYELNVYSITASKARDQVSLNDRDKQTLNFYNIDFKLKVKNSFDFRIFDMSLDESGNIVGTIESQDSIVKISQSGIVSVLCRTGSLHPYGICINNSGQIVAGLGSRKESEIKLVIYTADGSTVIDEVVNNEYNESMFMESLNQVKQLSTGEYVVAEPTRILCVGTEKDEKWTHDVPRPGLLAPCVYSMVCDRTDCVIYGDQRYDKINILNPKGDFIGLLMTKEDGIHLPCSLAIDEDANLYIGLMGKLLVVKYLRQ